MLLIFNQSKVMPNCYRTFCQIFPKFLPFKSYSKFASFEVGCKIFEGFRLLTHHAPGHFFQILPFCYLISFFSCAHLWPSNKLYVSSYFLVSLCWQASPVDTNQLKIVMVRSTYLRTVPYGVDGTVPVRGRKHLSKY